MKGKGEREGCCRSEEFAEREGEVVRFVVLGKEKERKRG